MSYTIRIEAFRKSYKTTSILFDRIIIQEKVTLLVGRNGSGKSTLMKAICGLIHYQGEIWSNTDSYAYMCEESLFPKDISVMVFLLALNALNKKPQEEKVIHELLELFRIDHKSDIPLSHLSKGMKAKVNLIQCLMSKADFYILDEPLSGLDAKGVEALLQWISESRKQFVISTHLLEDFSPLHAKVIHV